MKVIEYNGETLTFGTVLDKALLEEVMTSDEFDRMQESLLCRIDMSSFEAKNFVRMIKTAYDHRWLYRGATVEKPEELWTADDWDKYSVAAGYHNIGEYSGCKIYVCTYVDSESGLNEVLVRVLEDNARCKGYAISDYGDDNHTKSEILDILEESKEW